MSDRNTALKTRILRPRATVNETRDGRLNVVLEMPGVRREDLMVKVENNELQIVGTRVPVENAKYLLRERQYGSFMQSYTLDQTVDPSKVVAALEKGVLTLTLELKEHVKPRTIPVRGE